MNQYTYNLINLDKYFEYDEIRKGLFEYRAKCPNNINTRDNHNTFFAKRVLWSYDLHIGECLAGIIGKRTNFKMCDTELYRHPINYNDRGVISYTNLSQNDKLLNPRIIIEKYLKQQNLNPYIYHVDIETVMKAIFCFMYQYKRPYHEFLCFKQDFIDMIIFDLKLLNFDRKFENWYIRQDSLTKAIDLYPMFDNEMILGFDQEISSETFTADEIFNKDIKTTSNILTPKAMQENKSEVNYIELFEFLLENYPIQTKNSLSKFDNFSNDDLLEIMNNFDELTKERKTMAVQLFTSRSLGLEKVYSKCLEKSKVLPTIR